MIGREDIEMLLGACAMFVWCVIIGGCVLLVGGVVAVLLVVGVSVGVIAVVMVALAFAAVIAGDLGWKWVRRPPRGRPATPWQAGNMPSGSGGSFPRG